MAIELISKDTLEKLNELTQEIIAIKKALSIGTTSLTPLNYTEEMDKFFSSHTYNPIYTYNKKEFPNITKQLESLKLRVDKLELPEDLKEHILEFLDDQNNLYLTKKSIGEKEFSEHAHHLFDWGTDRLDLLLANTPNVEFQMDIKHRLQDVEKIKERFEQALTRYNITSFKVEIDTFSPHIINVGTNRIAIGSAIRRYECNVDRLIIHEIESHVLQNENIKTSKSSLVALSKYGNMHLYSEGLAIYNEVTTRKITPSAFETYYLRIKAVRLLHKSFREIFDTLSEDLPSQKAFVMTYRVKRGMADTSAPGGFPKDASYLLGYHEIETLISEKYPKKLLYATKSPSLSSLLQKYNILVNNPIIMPRFNA